MIRIFILKYNLGRKLFHNYQRNTVLSLLELLLSQIFVAKCNIFKNNILKIIKGAKIQFLFFFLIPVVWDFLMLKDYSED